MSRHFENRQVLRISLLVVASAAVFCNTFLNDFMWDDRFLITDNPHIRTVRNIPSFFAPRYWNELHPFPGQFRPTRTISLALDYYFWRLNPVGYHLTNLMLHVINVVLIYFLVLKIAAGRQDSTREEQASRYFFLGLPFLTAVFFAIHPIHTESINLIKNRSDLLACFFFLISLLLFINAFPGGGRKPRSLLIPGAWLCFIPAVLSKEMALTLPGVLVLYAGCFLTGTERRKALIRTVPYGAVILVYFWFLHAFIIPAGPASAGVPAPGDLGQHVLAVIKTVGVYLMMLMAPVGLNADHAFNLPVSLLEPAVLLPLAMLLPGIMAVRAYKRSRVPAFAFGWILLTLLPVANIVYLASRPIAEQRLYIPSLGFCLLLGYGIERLAGVRAKRLNPARAAVIGGVLAGVIVSLYAVVTVRRNVDWRDEVTFYSRTVAANPGSARMHNNLGIALGRLNRHEEAVSHYEAALRLQPEDINTRFNLGRAFYALGRYGEAVSQYQAGLRLQPDGKGPKHVSACINLGAALMKQGDIDQAARMFSRALALSPDNPDANYNLGTVLAARRNYYEAMTLFARLLAANPGHDQARREYEHCREMTGIVSGTLKENTTP